MWVSLVLVVPTLVLVRPRLVAVCIILSRVPDCPLFPGPYRLVTLLSAPLPALGMKAIILRK